MKNIIKIAAIAAMLATTAVSADWDMPWDDSDSDWNNDLLFRSPTGVVVRRGLIEGVQ